MKMYKRDYYDDESTENEQVGVGFISPEEAGWNNDEEYELYDIFWINFISRMKLLIFIFQGIC